MKAVNGSSVISDFTYTYTKAGSDTELVPSSSAPPVGPWREQTARARARRFFTSRTFAALALVEAAAVVAVGIGVGWADIWTVLCPSGIANGLISANYGQDGFRA